MVKFLPHGKTILLHGQTSPSWQNLSPPWLKLSLLTKVFFLAKPILLSKNIFPYWLNLSLLAKPFNFMVKPLSIGKTFSLHG
jgi:hypothetical protein